MSTTDASADSVMRYGLAGRAAFVTGVASGIGTAVARQLLAAGARVYGVDRDGEALARLATDLDAGARLQVQVVDVADTAAVDAAVDAAETALGPIALGASVAGVLSTTLVVDTDDAEWDRVFAVNARAVFAVSRALARRMIPRRAGSLVTVSSNAAFVPRHAMAAYAASKAASTMFTRCLGLELAPYGIRCNVVAPGSTDTPMQRGMWSGGDGAAAVIRGSLETFKAGIPLGKLATADDVAAAVLFLLSDQAAHITMTELLVDGGATLRA